LNSAEQNAVNVRADELAMWHDVFVTQQLPWSRFVQSAVLHAGAFAFIWMGTIAWLRQQAIAPKPVFDRSSVITYTPEEYLPPLDTGMTPAPAQQQKGDPVFAKQPILSVPREADNRRQTIVAPPDVRLNQDVPLPNIVALDKPAPEVPLEATRASMRMVSPETNIVPPSPNLDSARSKNVDALATDVVAPPPEIATHHSRLSAGPETAVVAPPPDMPKSSRGAIGDINIGPSAVVAPAPQLAVSEQHTLSGRGLGTLSGGGGDVVAPPPTISSSSGGKGGGRLVALGVSPVAPTGPVTTPSGNRRGTFAAGPQGKPGGTGTPGGASGSGSAPVAGTGTNGNSLGKGHGDSSLPSGLHVGAVNSAQVSNVASDGAGAKQDPALMASANVPRTNVKPATPVAPEKVTEVDRQVFGGKRFYSMTLNMPNLNSATGSWVIRFAELKEKNGEGALLPPMAVEKSDPGYPSELRKANVQGTVTLYAVIHSDGTVRDIRVISSPDERLDGFARDALGRWKFIPASKDGKPVALEAVVMIPFRIRIGF
jgi:TonB family protein